jgi:hypothetical protein
MGHKLARSVVEDRVEKIATDFSEDTHKAFLRLIFYIVTGKSYNDLELEDLIDGAGDYQVDVINIDDSTLENQAVITVIQATFAESLSSTKLIKMHTGLDYLLQQPKSKYSKLSNKSLASKINEFRELRSQILPSNIRLQCFYANLLDPPSTPGTTSEFLEQISRIKSDYGSSVGEFNFEALGPSKIFELIDRRERRGTKIVEKLKIIYDQNKANLLEHAIEGVNGVICTVPAEEIARVVNAYPSVFDENLRRFRGFGGVVNKAISESCKSSVEAPLFWFLNNGISIVCDNFDVHKDYDNPFINLENMQIVNGCQTSTTLALNYEDRTLQPSTKVMVRIFKTNSKDLSSKLVVTTNTQNKITARELRAKDEIQLSIQSAFDNKFDIFYERTPNEFADIPRNDRKPIVSNEKVGQAVFAIVKRKPSDARARLYKIWGEEYDRVFNQSILPEAYLLSYVIVDKAKEFKRDKYRTLKNTDIRREILANGILHLARIASFLLKGNDDWDNYKKLSAFIIRLKKDNTILVEHFNKALDIMKSIVKSNEQYLKSIGIALKSGRIDEDIDKKLYAPPKKNRITKK